MLRRQLQALDLGQRVGPVRTRNHDLGVEVLHRVVVEIVRVDRRVVPLRAVELVVAAIAGERIVAAPAIEDVGETVADKRVVAVAADRVLDLAAADRERMAVDRPGRADIEVDDRSGGHRRRIDRIVAAVGIGQRAAAGEACVVGEFVGVGIAIDGRVAGPEEDQRRASGKAAGVAGGQISDRDRPGSRAQLAAEFLTVEPPAGARDVGRCPVVHGVQDRARSPVRRRRHDTQILRVRVVQRKSQLNRLDADVVGQVELELHRIAVVVRDYHRAVRVGRRAGCFVRRCRCCVAGDVPSSPSAPPRASRRRRSRNRCWCRPPPFQLSAPLNSQPSVSVAPTFGGPPTALRWRRRASMFCTSRQPRPGLASSMSAAMPATCVEAAVVPCRRRCVVVTGRRPVRTADIEAMILRPT